MTTYQLAHIPFVLACVACWVAVLDFGSEINALCASTPAPNTSAFILLLVFLFFGCGYPFAAIRGKL